MFQDGGIDVTKTPNAFRGYFLPLFYSALRIISTNFLNNEFFLFNIFISLEMALIYTVCLPYIFNICVKETKITCGICISYMVLLYFWNGFLITPLSDLPALFFMFISICLMKYMTLHKITWIPFTGLSFLVGAFSYLAYNTRSIYLYGVIAQLIWFVLHKILDRAKLAVFFLAFVVSVAVFGSPQASINQAHGQKPTVQVLTSLYTADGVPLEKMQVLWGLGLDRYETYVGDSEQFSQAAVRFENPVGNELVRREQISEESFSYFDILKLFLKYPVEMISIYTSHLISYLTPCYSRTYISNIYTNKTLRVVVSSLIWIIGALAVFVTTKENGIKKLLQSALSCCGVLIPVLLILLGAPEIRFFIALYFIWYFYMGCIVDWRSTAIFLKKHMISSIVVIGIIFILWVTNVQNTFGENVVAGRPLLIADSQIQAQVQQVE